MDQEWDKSKDSPSKRTVARDTIWDPDDKKLMLSLMACSVNDLAHWFDPDVTKVEIMSSSPFSMLSMSSPEVPKDAAERGWFGPAWSFYGAGLCAIQKALGKY